jgi:membrane-bound lytic murein transglycosylase D
MREETGEVRGVEGDFWRIRSRLPSETREYVPLIFAAALVGKEPERYGLEGVERLMPVEIERVLVPGGTSLDVVGRAINVPAEDIRELNPHLIRGVTPPGAQPYPVNVPEGRSDVFASNFAGAQVAASAPVPAAAAAPTRSSQAEPTHRVTSGESLWVIARRHGVSVPALQRANHLGPRAVIRPGQLLRIPA